MKILLVEDDADLLDLLAYSLSRSGLTTLKASDPPSALEVFRSEQPDLVILDINLGGWNGLDVLRMIRESSTTPVILLTAMDGEEDKVRGLDLGADDYLTKPFSHAELLVRIKARLREHAQSWPAQPPEAREFVAGPLRLDPRAHNAVLHGVTLHLTATEFRLLHYLMQRQGMVLSPEALASHLWGDLDSDRRAAVRVLLHRIRKKFRVVQPDAEALLESRPRAGVRLAPLPRMVKPVEDNLS